MKLLQRGRAVVAQWPYPVASLVAALASFGCYTSMYAFRKAFAAGTFEGSAYLGVDYKVWLVIAQVVGYMLSKFYGIRFIAETAAKRRAQYILLLIAISWVALFAFAVTPAPWNIIFLFVNGFPLGMIWGLVCGYLEGRRNTEFLTAVMSTSLIFASGFVKSTGRGLMQGLGISEYWMPFVTGAVFALPLLFFVACLELIPPPNEEDKALRTARAPMDAAARRHFVHYFLPGIIITVVIYVFFTIMRDVRDNFEVEIWANFGVHDYSVYTRIDSMISVIVLVCISSLILVKDNLKAFTIIHGMIILGCILVGIGTWLFDTHRIDVYAWMSIAGLGLYMGYIPYNAIFFERMIATFRVKGNVGFIMYIADAMGYLGSVSILLIKEFGNTQLSWGRFFQQGVMAVSVIGGVFGLVSLLYFRQKKKLTVSSHLLHLSAAAPAAP
ncbi:hypothetical protein DCC81_04240 [Chitinophaga parva]|uniref:MFS transporter n=1 Tax=Chitinophaga parva TaxID=2169414 RepID=A0A2T7BM46_9BACT|nr:DUF5690 family protein [Chitinophaga parva]PUZ28700.1 hypothetical protein DCC81_04240 [Chitinophaga parva]